MRNWAGGVERRSGISRQCYTRSCTMMRMPTPVILGGNRIPFARSDGPYAEASNQDMLTTAIDGLVARFNLQGERLGEVAAGAVLKHARDFNLTRESVLGSALDSQTPAYDMQM